MNYKDIFSFENLEEEARGHKSVHLVTANAQYFFEIVFKRILNLFPRNTKFCLDSAPALYIWELFYKGRATLKQGSDIKTKTEIFMSAKKVDSIVVIGGTRNSDFLNSFENGKVVSFQNKVIIDDMFLEEIEAATKNAKKILFLLFLGVPKQDRLAEALHKKFAREKTLITIGLGGSLDIWTGKIMAAPPWVKALCLEGVWRLMKEPSWRRLKRIFVSGLGIVVAPMAFQKIREFYENPS